MVGVAHVAATSTHVPLAFGRAGRASPTANLPRPAARRAQSTTAAPARSRTFMVPVESLIPSQAQASTRPGPWGVLTGAGPGTALEVKPAGDGRFHIADGNHRYYDALRRRVAALACFTASSPYTRGLA